MAAADSFIGGGLADSPYAEARDRIEQLEREAASTDTVIRRLQDSLRARSVAYLDQKMRANKAERRIADLERDIEWLRDLVTKLAER